MKWCISFCTTPCSDCKQCESEKDHRDKYHDYYGFCHECLMNLRCDHCKEPMCSCKCANNSHYNEELHDYDHILTIYLCNFCTNFPRCRPYDNWKYCYGTNFSSDPQKPTGCNRRDNTSTNFADSIRFFPDLFLYQQVKAATEYYEQNNLFQKGATS